MGRPGYPAEFRRKVLDLLAEEPSVASVAHAHPLRRCGPAHNRRNSTTGFSRAPSGRNGLDRHQGIDWLAPPSAAGGGSGSGNFTRSASAY